MAPHVPILGEGDQSVFLSELEQLPETLLVFVDLGFDLGDTAL